MTNLTSIYKAYSILQKSSVLTHLKMSRAHCFHSCHKKALSCCTGGWSNSCRATAPTRTSCFEDPDLLSSSLIFWRAKNTAAFCASLPCVSKSNAYASWLVFVPTYVEYEIYLHLFLQTRLLITLRESTYMGEEPGNSTGTAWAPLACSQGHDLTDADSSSWEHAVWKNEQRVNATKPRTVG